MIDFAVSDKVKQLRREGLRPSEHLVRAITKAGAAAVGPLLALALDTDLLHEDPPDGFAPLHALRLLGELGSTEIIAPLLRGLPIDLFYPDEELPETWAEEMPQIIGRLGTAAVEPLWAVADDRSYNADGRGAAIQGLAYAAIGDPSARDAVVAGLRERLARDDDPAFVAHLIAGLASLGVADAYQEVMALYRQGKVDPEIMPAGSARQYLLSPNDNRLGCVRHSLWERYDQHGPFAKPREA